MQTREQPARHDRTRIVTSMVIVVALGVLLQALALSVGNAETGLATDLHLTMVARWMLAASVVVVVLLVERQPWSSLGTRPLTRTSWIWASVLGAAQMLQILLPTLDSRTRSTIEQAGPLDLLLVLVTAAVTEEIIFRGFLQERLTVLLDSRWVAGVLAGAAFLLVHVRGTDGPAPWSA